MPFNGSGVYSLPGGSTIADGTTADAADINTPLADIESALTLTLLRDGSTDFGGDQSMGDHKLTSLAIGTARTDAARVLDTMTTAFAQAATVGGTVNAITTVFSPTFAAYTTGMRIRWVSGGANTSTVTMAVDGLATKAVNKLDNQPLVQGDTGPSGHICEAVYDGTRFLLVNPYNVLGWNEKFKLINENESASTSMQADDELVFALEANARYRAEWTVLYSTAAAADFKFSIDSNAATDPSPCVVIAEYIDPTGVPGGASVGINDVTTIAASGGTEGLIRITVYADNGADTGNLRLMWAPAALSGTTTVRRGSSVRWRKV